MLKNGMTYYADECYANAIDCEKYVFSNMLDIIHIWENSFIKFDNSIRNYLLLDNNFLNLSKMDLGELNLRRTDLSVADLRYANLAKTDLCVADIEDVHLENVILFRNDTR